MRWEFIPGIENPADSLRRLCIMNLSRNDEDKSIHAKRWHKQHIGGASTPVHKYVDCIKVAELIKAYPKDPWFKVTENITSLLKSLGLWWKDDKLVIPNDKKLKDKVLVKAHDSIFAGHLGRTKT
jgi:hypothetical protein